MRYEIDILDNDEYVCLSYDPSKMSDLKAMGENEIIEHLEIDTEYENVFTAMETFFSVLSIKIPDEESVEYRVATALYRKRIKEEW